MLVDVVTPLGHYVAGLSYTARTEVLEQQAATWVAEGKAEWLAPGGPASVRGTGAVH